MQIIVKVSHGHQVWTIVPTMVFKMLNTKRIIVLLFHFNTHTKKFIIQKVLVKLLPGELNTIMIYLLKLSEVIEKKE